MSRRGLERADRVSFRGAALGFLLGSGLSAVAEALDTEEVVSFDRIEGLGSPSVEGHPGEIRRCRVSGRPCLFVCGRRHFYEGEMEAIGALVEFLRGSGLRQLVVTSAAGSLVKSVFPGELVLVSDVVDFQHRPPFSRTLDLRGTGRPGGAGRLGLDAGMSKGLWAAASRAKIGLGRGAAVSCAGPAYETPAEVRALQETGASVVTMSGAPEIQAANALGIRTAMIAVVTNWASGISTVRLRHEDVVETARRAADKLRRLVVEFVGAWL